MITRKYKQRRDIIDNFKYISDCVKEDCKDSVMAKCAVLALESDSALQDAIRVKSPDIDEQMQGYSPFNDFLTIVLD